MKTAGIIPARYGSTRFPGKPLALIHGISMIQRVYRRAAEAKLLDVVAVATDDKRIADHVTAFGGHVIMTNSSHQSGTERCAEAVSLLGDQYETVVNIQGDEPYIHPGQIDQLVACFSRPETAIATLIKTIANSADLDNVHLPKVVVSETGNAMYFSRSIIPYAKPEEREWLVREGRYYKHIGIYGYRTDVLKKLAVLPKGMLESCESLEQLRWLENGYSIAAAVSMHDNFAVDTPEDILSIEKLFPAG
ncbi:MAG TPA: 3-deoxy-manno-octulosonate cytidylyltransferase [Bacteroidia bacterium]|nr:3-deoxy-manno-octulosonate cytidylyltransferase [Bacteroidia bacterium]